MTRKPFKFLLFAAAFAPAGVCAADGYNVEFVGAPNGLTNQLRLASSLARGTRQFATASAIERIGRRDIDALAETLKAAGYYDAKLSFVLSADRPDAQPTARYFVEPGPLFRITDHVVVYLDGAEANRPMSFQEAKVEVNNAADGATLLENQQRFVEALRNAGFPAATAGFRRAEARRADGEASAIYGITSGQRARFGEVTAVGLVATDETFLTKLKTWNDGDMFERAKLIAYRDRIAETGLFRAIEVEPGPPDDEGSSAIIVTVEERRRRTVGAGASFSTVEGPGGRLFLEYRNMFGSGERARAEIEGSQIRQSLAFSYLKPLPLFPGAFFANLRLLNETTDVFDALTLDLASGFSRRWLNDRLETRGGIGMETSKIRNAGEEERNYFISAPLSAVWSTEPDPLNLSSGERIALSITPYAGSTAFVQTEIQARARTNFGPQERLTIAGRLKLGATQGVSFTNLPINKRFFLGGGSSIRGYAFQAAGAGGPDRDLRPIGGASILEGALEFRVRTFGNLQIAAFADAGTVAEQSFPDITGNYLAGAGGGIRYLTPIGPIRVDAAFPLERFEGEAGWQLYVSLGQPF